MQVFGDPLYTENRGICKAKGGGRDRDILRISSASSTPDPVLCRRDFCHFTAPANPACGDTMSGWHLLLVIQLTMVRGWGGKAPLFWSSCLSGVSELRTRAHLTCTQKRICWSFKFPKTLSKYSSYLPSISVDGTSLPRITASIQHGRQHTS